MQELHVPTSYLGITFLFERLSVAIDHVQNQRRHAVPATAPAPLKDNLRQAIPIDLRQNAIKSVMKHTI